MKATRARMATVTLATMIALLGSATLPPSASANHDDDPHPGWSGPAPGPFRGTVIAPLAVRTAWTPAGDSLRTLKPGTEVRIWCKTRGVPVDGNPRWYSIGWEGSEHVAARYVRNVGSAPRWCGYTPQTGQVVGRPGVNVRSRPTTRARLTGFFPYGKIIGVVCKKVDGPKVDGNPRWYQLFNGGWVAARYVQHSRTVPVRCDGRLDPGANL